MDLKKDISTRSDIYQLVERFYSKLRADHRLGPIFEKHISDWPKHFEHLTDFWESQLLFTKRFRGNPGEVHVKVDQEEETPITNELFGHWLNHWFQTVDELYTGEIAERAKHNARKLSTFLYLKMWEARQIK